MSVDISIVISISNLKTKFPVQNHSFKLYYQLESFCRTSFWLRFVEKITSHSHLRIVVVVAAAFSRRRVGIWINFPISIPFPRLVLAEHPFWNCSTKLSNLENESNTPINKVLEFECYTNILYILNSIVLDGLECLKFAVQHNPISFFQIKLQNWKQVNNNWQMILVTLGLAKYSTRLNG